MIALAGWLGSLDVLKNFVNLEDEEGEEGKGEEVQESHSEDERNVSDPSSNKEVGTGTAIVVPSSSVETEGKGNDTAEKQVFGDQDALQRNEAGSVKKNIEWKDDDGFEDVDIAAEGKKNGSMVSGQAGKDQKDKEEKVVPSQVQQHSVAGRKENTVTESKKKKKKKKKNSSTLSNSAVATEQEKVPVAVAASQEAKEADKNKEILKNIGSSGEKEYAEMEKKVQELENIIKERESQLERKSEEVAEAKRVTDAVVKKNEELAMTQASISEFDLENMRRYGF